MFEPFDKQKILSEDFEKSDKFNNISHKKPVYIRRLKPNEIIFDYSLCHAALSNIDLFGIFSEDGYRLAITETYESAIKYSKNNGYISNYAN
jgi:hypothetical protein